MKFAPGFTYWAWTFKNPGHGKNDVPTENDLETTEKSAKRSFIDLVGFLADKRIKGKGLLGIVEINRNT